MVSKSESGFVGGTLTTNPGRCKGTPFLPGAINKPSSSSLLSSAHSSLPTPSSSSASSSSSSSPATSPPASGHPSPSTSSLSANQCPPSLIPSRSGTHRAGKEFILPKYSNNRIPGTHHVRTPSIASNGNPSSGTTSSLGLPVISSVHTRDRNSFSSSTSSTISSSSSVVSSPSFLPKQQKMADRKRIKSGDQETISHSVSTSVPPSVSSSLVSSMGPSLIPNSCPLTASSSSLNRSGSNRCNTRTATRSRPNSVLVSSSIPSPSHSPSLNLSTSISGSSSLTRSSLVNVRRKPSSTGSPAPGIRSRPNSCGRNSLTTTMTSSSLSGSEKQEKTPEPSVTHHTVKGSTPRVKETDKKKSASSTPTLSGLQGRDGAKTGGGISVAKVSPLPARKSVTETEKISISSEKQKRMAEPEDKKGPSIGTNVFNDRDTTLLNGREHHALSPIHPDEQKEVTGKGEGEVAPNSGGKGSDEMDGKVQVVSLDGDKEVTEVNDTLMVINRRIKEMEGEELDQMDIKIPPTLTSLSLFLANNTRGQSGPTSGKHVYHTHHHHHQHHHSSNTNRWVYTHNTMNGKEGAGGGGGVRVSHKNKHNISLTNLEVDSLSDTECGRHMNRPLSSASHVRNVSSSKGVLLDLESAHSMLTTAESESHELRDLQLKVRSSKETVSDLTAKLFANAQMMSAFEKTLSTMSLRMQQMTLVNHQKDLEINHLKAIVDVMTAYKEQEQENEANEVNGSMDSFPSLKKVWLKSPFGKNLKDKLNLSPKKQPTPSPLTKSSSTSPPTVCPVSPSTPSSSPKRKLQGSASSTSVHELKDKLHRTDSLLEKTRLEAISSAFHLESAKELVKNLRDEMASLRKENAELDMKAKKRVSLTLSSSSSMFKSLLYC